MNFGQIRDRDISNGPGIRTSIFVTGCNFHCKNCFNEEYQDFNAGEKFTDEVLNKFVDLGLKEHCSGWSILGGEPLHQGEDMFHLIDHIRKIIDRDKLDKTIWLWTGYKIEDIMNDELKMNIVKNCDYIIDGLYIDEQRDLTLKYRGSKNQRLIAMRKTIYPVKLNSATDLIYDDGKLFKYVNII
jgi:anaerobic ribonucleoside-triphosphate reductase activating protein